MSPFDKWLDSFKRKMLERRRNFEAKSRRQADNWEYVCRITGTRSDDTLDEIVEKVAITLKRLRGEPDDLYS